MMVLMLKVSIMFLHKHKYFHLYLITLGAMALAKEASVALVGISQFAREGSDRDDLSFDVKEGQQCQVVPPNQNNLVSSVASTGTKTIVAATSPGAVLMPWKEQVEAILLGFMPGQEYGHALADVLFGDVNPSAKLPMTIPNKENEVEFSRVQYPGIKLETVYSERSLIDYRWYTAHNVAPAFPFGFGMSYSTFQVKGLSVKGLQHISVDVTNTGKMAGSEVVQLYVQFPDLAGTPPLQLKGFQKTKILASGESETVTFSLRARDLSIWDIFDHDWKVVPGTYKLFVGNSSDNLSLQAELKL